VLIDTDVLIWYLRGNENAQKIVEANIPFKISAVTYFELMQGMKNKSELKILQKFLKTRAIEIIQINENISSRAMFLIEDYCLSHSMEMGDALIAATTLENQEILLTANDRHYNYIPNLQVQKFKVR
jgi:predicted nucleic acid-binding protein